MQINNEIYQTYGHDWWAKDAAFDISSLRYCMNPVRYGYFKRRLQELHFPGKTVLDVGCGGGFLAEEFARDGFAVTGIDPAARSIEAARKHAADNNLEIDYREGKGEALAFSDGSFDIVACCDVLEHVDDLSLVISEIARTLKAGGVFCYDTVNRTWLSKFALIKISGLANQELTGISSRKNPLALLASLRALKKRRLSNQEIAATFALCETDDLRISYMGYAIRSSYV
jgi:2-polyprenyl-6-hydroxyphenyl methylase/3-demethylubiquinone-9 3-methyltransferase